MKTDFICPPPAYQVGATENVSPVPTSGSCRKVCESGTNTKQTKTLKNGQDMFLAD